VLGDLDEAVAATLTARQLASRMAASSSDGLAASNLAGFYIELGRLDEADAVLDEAIALIEKTGNRYVLAESLVFRARIAAGRGDLVAARRHAERSLSLARQQSNQLDVAIAMRILAQLDSRAAAHDVAIRRIDDALAIAKANDAFEGLRTRAARARILAAAGNPGAEPELTALHAELTRLGTKRELAVLRKLDEVR
jgi:tetratricopeptide (TPR) repeat protein